MSHRPAVLLLIAVALLWDAGATRAIGPAPTWQPRETIATNANLPVHLGADRILAFDHYGDPGVAYVQLVNRLMWYARKVPGVGWQSVVADGGNGGSYPSLAFDRRELPWIGYGDANTEEARIENFNGIGWASQVADPSFALTGEFASLAFDSTGKVALAYRDHEFDSLKFVKDTDGDGAVTDETLGYAAFGEQGYYATLAFDPLNRAMIAHYDASAADLKFSVLDVGSGLGWVTTTVDSAGLTGSHSSLAIDPDTGFPAISYYDDTTDDLRFAQWNGATWIKTTVDSTGIVGLHTSLAFDPADGNPAISYYDQTNGNLKLAWFNGTIWQTQPVDTVGDVGVNTSLAFNPYGNGFPAIVYGDNLNNLYFIEDPPASVPEPQAAILFAVGSLLSSVLYRRRRADWETQ